MRTTTLPLSFGRAAALSALAIGATAWSPIALAFDLPSPWCIGNGGGTFLCSNKEERAELVAKNATLDYLDFVKLAFAADTIQFVPPRPGTSPAMTLHRSGGGILDLTSPSSDSVRSRMATAATDWFRAFCLANAGKVVRYPLNDPVVNIERLACHPKAEASGASPMFAIQVSRGVVYRAKDQVPVVAMEHLTGTEAILTAWGYPKVFNVGDSTAQGLIIEIKPPLAKVQRTSGDQVAELWVPVKALRPAAKPAEGG